MMAPHAHISNTKGHRDRFGQDKSHFRIYKQPRKSILNRKMFNITSDLIHRPEFKEVVVLKQKIKSIQNLNTPAAVDN